jgi:ribose 5-phosphate isomerase B
VRIYLGSDHAGFDLKAAVAAHLAEHGHEPTDCGPPRFDPVDDYPPYCIAVARHVVSHPGSLGVVIGGSGNGEQIAANKVRGVRAALAYSVKIARLAREHNDANVLGLGARAHETQEALAIVDAFVGTAFSGEPRHRSRIEMISAFESQDA